MLVKEACNLCSGYLFSKPLPADGIVSFLQRRGVPANVRIVGLSPASRLALCRTKSDEVAIAAPGSVLRLDLSSPWTLRHASPVIPDFWELSGIHSVSLQPLGQGEKVAATRFAC